MTWILGARKLMGNGVLEQLRVGLDAQGFHHSVLLEGDRSRFDIQATCYFLHRHAFREQLQDFILPAGDPSYMVISLVEKEADCFARYQRR